MPNTDEEREWRFRRRCALVFLLLFSATMVAAIAGIVWWYARAEHDIRVVMAPWLDTLEGEPELAQAEQGILTLASRERGRAMVTGLLCCVAALCGWIALVGQIRRATRELERLRGTRE